MQSPCSSSVPILGGFCGFVFGGIIFCELFGAFVSTFDLGVNLAFSWVPALVCLGANVFLYLKHMITAIQNKRYFYQEPHEIRSEQKYVSKLLRSRRLPPLPQIKASDTRILLLGDPNIPKLILPSRVKALVVMVLAATASVLLIFVCLL